MAEPKAKGVNGNHTNTNTNGNHAADRPATTKQSKLWQLLELAKEVAKDVDSVQEHESSVEGRRALEREVEAKAVENQRLREFNDKVVKEFSEHKSQASAKTDTLFAEFQQRLKQYESDKSAVESMEKEVAGMRERLQAAEASQSERGDEVKKLKKQLQTANVNAKDHASEMKEMNAECEIHRARMQTGISELDACKTQLSQAQSDLGEGVLHTFSSKELKKLTEDLRALSKKSHALVMEYFNEFDGAADAESEIQDLKERFPDIPLTTESTRNAALLRCAVAEAVISDVLTSQIFVPFYLAPDLKASATRLLDIFGDDERRRTIYRCQILGSAAHTDDATRIQEDIVRKASNEVRNTLHPLVVAFKQAGFYGAVPNLFREALSLWLEAQRSRELLAAAAPDLERPEAPGRHAEYDQGVVVLGSPSLKGPRAAGAASKRRVAAVVFPQVSSREGLVFAGMALWADQGVFAAPEAHDSATSGAETVEESAPPSTKKTGPRRRKASSSG